ncbi:MAG: hypothetical protein R2854_25980 [Caldilineaceae bacterium]
MVPTTPTMVRSNAIFWSAVWPPSAARRVFHGQVNGMTQHFAAAIVDGQFDAAPGVFAQERRRAGDGEHVAPTLMGIAVGQFDAADGVRAFHGSSSAALSAAAPHCRRPARNRTGRKYHRENRDEYNG